GVQIGDYNLDHDFWRWLIACGLVGAAEEVVLVNHLMPGQSISANGQFDCLENGGLAGVVVAEEDRSPGEVEGSAADAAEVLNLDTCNAHGFSLSLVARQSVPPSSLDRIC